VGRNHAIRVKIDALDSQSASRLTRMESDWLHVDASCVLSGSVSSQHELHWVTSASDFRVKIDALGWVPFDVRSDEESMATFVVLDPQCLVKIYYRARIEVVSRPGVFARRCGVEASTARGGRAIPGVLSRSSFRSTKLALFFNQPTLKNATNLRSPQEKSNFGGIPLFDFKSPQMPVRAPKMEFIFDRFLQGPNLLALRAF
jgi:hypothetical protein